MARADFKFFLAHRARYCEIDAQGIVFYGNYLSFFDNTLTDFFRQFDFDFVNYPRDTGCDFHVVRAEIDYRKPVALDEEIVIGARIDKVGRSSITFRLEVHPKSGDDLRCAGLIVWVHADQNTHKSVALPPSLLDRIAAADFAPV